MGISPHLSGTLLALLLIGCGGNSKSDTETETGEAQKDTQTTETGTAETGSLDTQDSQSIDTGTPTTRPFPLLKTSNGQFVEPDGGVVILRGLNVAGNSKVPDFRPLNRLEDLDPLPSWGMNVIRLLFTWEAYEPVEGQLDTDYLNTLSDIADYAGELGLRVIIDFHQDGYSRHLAGGCGDGFPEWTIPPGLTKDTPDNDWLCITWPVLVSADPDVHAAYSAFYADTHGVRSRYLGTMSVLAAHFADHPAVIGFDLMNEPWGWEDSEIAPLYNDAAEVIRAQMPEAILWIEGHASTNNGITQSALPKPEFENYAYAPHFYEAAVLASHIWTGIPTGVEFGFETMISKARDLEAPLFVGEFGTHGGTLNATAYMELHYDQLDKYFASSVQWNYTPRWTEDFKDGWNREDLSIVDNTGKLRGNFTIRPQPQRFAGTPMEFLAEDSKVTVRWSNDPDAGDTRIFLPAEHLWNTTTPQLNTVGSGLACSYDATPMVVSCASEQLGEMTVFITPP